MWTKLAASFSPSGRTAKDLIGDQSDLVGDKAMELALSLYNDPELLCDIKCVDEIVKVYSLFSEYIGFEPPSEDPASNRAMTRMAACVVAMYSRYPELGYVDNVVRSLLCVAATCMAEGRQNPCSLLCRSLQSWDSRFGVPEWDAIPASLLRVSCPEDALDQDAYRDALSDLVRYVLSTDVPSFNTLEYLILVLRCADRIRQTRLVL